MFALKDMLTEADIAVTTTQCKSNCSLCNYFQPLKLHLLWHQPNQYCYYQKGDSVLKNCPSTMGLCIAKFTMSLLKSNKLNHTTS